MHLYAYICVTRTSNQQVTLKVVAMKNMGIDFYVGFSNTYFGPIIKKSVYGGSELCLDKCVFPPLDIIMHFGIRSGNVTVFSYVY